ncbi:cytochrome P450, partial [Trametes punicea]
WNPALPLVVPHRTLVADEYRGVEIPAGCMVIANTWAMTRDSRYYPNPEEFRPERYLTIDGQKHCALIPSHWMRWHTLANPGGCSVTEAGVVVESRCT